MPTALEYLLLLDNDLFFFRFVHFDDKECIFFTISIEQEALYFYSATNQESKNKKKNTMMMKF